MGDNSPCSHSSIGWREPPDVSQLSRVGECTAAVRSVVEVERIGQDVVHESTLRERIESHMVTVPSQHSESMWKKASASGVSGCVEVASLATASVGVRDSKNRDGAVFEYTTSECGTFHPHAVDFPSPAFARASRDADLEIHIPFHTRSTSLPDWPTDLSTGGYTGPLVSRFSGHLPF
jgi:hypothetical protein